MPSVFVKSWNYIRKSNVNKTGKVIFVNANIFRELEQELLKAKKKGTKFYSPKELIKINTDSKEEN